MSVFWASGKELWREVNDIVSRTKIPRQYCAVSHKKTAAGAVLSPILGEEHVSIGDMEPYINYL